MPMNVFEEKVLKISDIRRLVSETMQLENYLFRHPEPKPDPKEDERLGSRQDKLNDLDLWFDCLPELAAHVLKVRSANISQQYGFKPQRLVRVVKKQADLNRTMFFRKFMMLHGLAQLFELKEEKHNYFSPEQLSILEKAQQNREDPYALEKEMVRNFDCDESWPICLYDFTLKNLLLD